MLFNSLQYAIFFPIVYILYWTVFSKDRKLQNLLILLSSYFFYACWDWRFMFLLIFSTLLDYFSGVQIERQETQGSRKFWLWLSIIINLGFLAIFKYYNFFATSLSDLLKTIGWEVDFVTLQVILPVGISFYTFHGLSYVLDIYNKKITAEKNFVDYAVFVSFFPLLVAGPIERATHLLPQILKPRVFDYHKSVDGLRQILWGLFKKIVIADNCAEYANLMFDSGGAYNSISYWLGALFFTFQIYGDFSGYSDIALGSARLLGFELLKNFNYPYFSRDIAEFWRRWHISLSSWFKDYLYIPLGGSKAGPVKKVVNTFIIFLVSGFWHGANWTFIVWGFLNALYIMPSIIFNTNRNNIEIVAKGKVLPSFRELSSILITFLLTVFAWIFFRAESVGHAFFYIKKLFGRDIFSLPNFPGLSKALIILIFVAIFILIEWRGREENFAIQKFLLNKPNIIRYIFYALIIIAIFLFCGREQQFIYFQF